MMPIRNSYDQNWLPSIFNDLFDSEYSIKKSSNVPAINVLEDDNEYRIEVAAPGMTKEDFSISLTNEDYITISLEKKNKEEDNKKKYLRREFSFSKFQQTLSMPDDVDRDNISASMQNGILTINLCKIKKNEKSNEPRMIDIK